MNGKKIIALILAVMMVMALCSCDGEDVNNLKGVTKDGQRIVTEFANGIEDNKEALQEGLDKLQGIADEAIKGIYGTD